MDDHNEERMEESYDEAELSDDEFEEEYSVDNLLDRVESNDPSLTMSTLILIPNNDDDHLPQNYDRLARMIVAIGRNTQLKALMFDGYRARLDDDGYRVQLGEAQATGLFCVIACNQSIKRLHFNNCDEYLGNACRILTPLCKTNQVERISIDDCELNHEDIRLLTTSLTEFDSLKEFALTDARLGMFHHDPQEVVRGLIQALSGHSRLRKLDLSSTNVGKLGCSALVGLLSNPNINLRVLNLISNNLGDAEAAVLASGMAGNTSLKEINLSNNTGVTQAGWQALFGPLSNSSCRLESIKLARNDINDAAAQSLSTALTSSATLKTLDLEFIRGITLTGWRVLFGALLSSTCALENLDLSSNELNDGAMTSLTDALATNRSLKSLNLYDNTGVNGAAWQRFFSTVLANTSSELEKLGLCYCDINDATIRALTNALVNNSKLKMLYLTGNNQITNTGWEMFSSVLESPYTELEELYLGGDDIDDDTATYSINRVAITSLVNSLANNKTLKKLIFDHSADWEPPLSVVCNAASIMSTYNSNHSLQKIGHEDDIYSPEEFQSWFQINRDDLVSMLKINRENSPIQAARLKIIKTHFKEGFVAQPFVGVDLNVLPHIRSLM